MSEDNGLAHRRDLDRIRLEHLYEMARDRREVVANLALLGLKSLVLLNGGAIVALFTILAHFDQLAVNGVLLWGAFIAFCAGVVSGLVALISAFWDRTTSG